MYWSVGALSPLADRQPASRMDNDKSEGVSFFILSFLLSYSHPFSRSLLLIPGLSAKEVLANRQFRRCWFQILTGSLGPHG